MLTSGSPVFPASTEGGPLETMVEPVILDTPDDPPTESVAGPRRATGLRPGTRTAAPVRPRSQLDLGEIPTLDSEDDDTMDSAINLVPGNIADLDDLGQNPTKIDYTQRAAEARRVRERREALRRAVSDRGAPPGDSRFLFAALTVIVCLAMGLLGYYVST